MEFADKTIEELRQQLQLIQQRLDAMDSQRNTAALVKAGLIHKDVIDKAKGNKR